MKQRTFTLLLTLFCLLAGGMTVQAQVNPFTITKNGQPATEGTDYSWTSPTLTILESGLTMKNTDPDTPTAATIKVDATGATDPVELTLTGVNINTGNRLTALTIEQSAQLIINGKNSLESLSGSGIMSSPLEITGGGKLVVSSGFYGIKVDRSTLKIKNVTVIATGANSDIQSDDDMTIENCTLEATGKIGIVCSKNISITNSVVTANGTNGAIKSHIGAITFDESYVTAKSLAAGTGITKQNSVFIEDVSGEVIGSYTLTEDKTLASNIVLTINDGCTLNNSSYQIDNSDAKIVIATGGTLTNPTTTGPGGVTDASPDHLEIKKATVRVIVKQPTEGGTITVTNKGVPLNNGENNVEENSLLTFLNTPDADYVFDCYTADGQPVNVNSYTATAPVTLSAVFKKRDNPNPPVPPVVIWYKVSAPVVSGITYIRNEQESDHLDAEVLEGASFSFFLKTAIGIKPSVSTSRGDIIPKSSQG